LAREIRSIHEAARAIAATETHARLAAPAEEDRDAVRPPWAHSDARPADWLRLREPNSAHDGFHLTAAAKNLRKPRKLTAMLA